MSAYMNWRPWLFRGLAAMLAVIVPLALAEIGARVTAPVIPRAPSGAVFCGDCGHIFELNTRHVGISSQKLRDREFAPVPSQGTYRIMVLGDSLPYGPGVAPSATFPKQLEKLLDGPFGKVEVMNTGVTGYNTYNERQWWLNRGRAFHPSLVIVSICLNDVVDPLLHWAISSDATGQFSVDRVPPEAIPNPDYHTQHALPLLRRIRAARRSRTTRLLQMSVFYRRVIAPLFSTMPDASAIVGGQQFPTYLVGEDTIGIDVLMDYDSVEWRWLRDQLDKLVDSIRKEDTKVMLLINPVQYQLAPKYPFFPQQLFDRYCRDRGLSCLDALPSLRAGGGEQLFRGKQQSIVDVWHYTADGHDVVAQALATYLERAHLLPPRTTR